MRNITMQRLVKTYLEDIGIISGVEISNCITVICRNEMYVVNKSIRQSILVYTHT
jgi:hypothetical protein